MKKNNGENTMKKLWILPLILILLLAACNIPQQTDVTNAPSEPSEAVSEDAPAEDLPGEAANTTAEEQDASTAPETDTNSEQAQADASSAPDQSPELTDIEEAALLYMREEEKLARDTYLAMYEIWGLPIFQNIADSEQTHTDAVKTLIDRYGLQDQFASEQGVFYNQTLQDLYDQLVEQGSKSLADALKVGAAIEEIDIIDLQESLEEVEKDDIQQVFENLLRGSYNHLRAFVNTLENQTGEVYTPQYMTNEAYQEALSARGNCGGGWRGKP
jgi:hypothetical protein